jgi:hypothetical protein
VRGSGESWRDVGLATGEDAGDESVKPRDGEDGGDGDGV